MSIQDQLIEKRKAVIDDIFKVVDSHVSDVGVNLATTDIIGILEMVKLEYFKEVQGDNLLSDTSYGL